MIGEYMYIHRIGYEKCDRLKKSVKLIYSHNCVHYVVSGQGFFNGERLCGGMGFVCRKGEAIEYYPDPSDPFDCPLYMVKFPEGRLGIYRTKQGLFRMVRLCL